CGATRHVDSLPPPYSLLDRAAAAELIPWCAAHGTGVVGYSPLGSGLLRGGLHPPRARDRPAGGWVPLPAVAVAWGLATPGVTGAIVRARRPSQVDGWLPAGSLRLTDADLAARRAGGGGTRGQARC